MCAQSRQKGLPSDAAHAVSRCTLAAPCYRTRSTSWSTRTRCGCCQLSAHRRVPITGWFVGSATRGDQVECTVAVCVSIIYMRCVLSPSLMASKLTAYPHLRSQVLWGPQLDWRLRSWLSSSEGWSRGLEKGWEKFLSRTLPEVGASPAEEEYRLLDWIPNICKHIWLIKGENLNEPLILPYYIYVQGEKHFSSTI